MRDLLKAAARRRLERAAASAWAKDDPQFNGQRLSIEAAAAALTRDKALTPMQKGAFRSAVLGAS
jgi:hypothetical protein